MKKRKVSVLEFNKQSIVNLDSNQMNRLIGGTNPQTTDMSLYDVNTNIYIPNPSDMGDLTTSYVATNTQTGANFIFSKLCPATTP